MGESSRRFLIRTGIAILAYPFFALGGIPYLNLILNSTSQKIASQSELEQLVSNEKKRQNCDVRITPLLDESYIGAQAYELSIGAGLSHIKMGGEFATKLAVVHEVYHICDKHDVPIFEDHGLNHLAKIFYIEPKATAYTLMRRVVDSL